MKVILLIVSALGLVLPGFAQQQIVADLPEVRSALTLAAVYDPLAGHNAFAYAGGTVPPVIRVLPGKDIRLHYVNNLPGYSDEECATGLCSNMTNLHFHGLHVSPKNPQDDVLSMMAMPGQALDYKVIIPPDAPPGLYWYHTHPHGESARQDLDGMSGAIVIDGIDRYYPELRNMRERVLVLRDRDLASENAETRSHLLQQVDVPAQHCGTSNDNTPERIFTVNREVRSRIPIHPGERQFWRIVNASPDRYVDLQIGGQQFEIVALDGMPLSYHDRTRHTRKVNHILVAPAGRVEAIVTGPAAGTNTKLSTQCVDTGVDGDLNPSMVIADMVSTSTLKETSRKVPTTTGAPVYREFPPAQIQKMEASKPDFTVSFTEDKNGFYINEEKFSMDSKPMLKVHIGSLQHWQVVNATHELHPFHIHQVHFLVYALNGVPLQDPEWLDTVNVPYNNGTVDLVMDFTDPIIRGMSVFHCHLLTHEDKGMMAKILFQ